MSTYLTIPYEELIEIPSPHLEPRLAFHSLEPRKVDNLTLIDGKTFSATNVGGDIYPPGSPDVGFFHDDTRFLSHLELRIGGHRTVVLSSTTEKTFSSQIELTTGNITLRDSFDLPENTIHIRREQLLASEIFFDRMSFENFNLTPVDFTVEIVVDADFVDVFQVRGVARQQHGQYFQPMVRDQGIAFYYRGLDGVMRETLVKVSPQPTEFQERGARWELRLEPLKRVELELSVTPFVEGQKSRAQVYEMDHQLRSRRANFARWEAASTNFQTDNDVFDDLLKTAIGDFHALQIPDGDQHIIAAGIPWFATIFGRDSIIAAYQSLSLNPQLATDTLRVLARYQGKEYNDWLDEEPGKILHEYRQGEMTRDGEMPFGPYYGSVDATPLFLVLLSETFNWTADEQLVEELLPNAYAALEWIDKYGDLDDDGFVEYLRRSPKGLANQGWKDSWDANMHRDGTVAKPPIALCERRRLVRLPIRSGQGQPTVTRLSNHAHARKMATATLPRARLRSPARRQAPRNRRQIVRHFPQLAARPDSPDRLQRRPRSPAAGAALLFNPSRVARCADGVIAAWQIPVGRGLSVSLYTVLRVATFTKARRTTDGGQSAYFLEWRCGAFCGAGGSSLHRQSSTSVGQCRRHRFDGGAGQRERANGDWRVGCHGRSVPFEHAGLAQRGAA